MFPLHKLPYLVQLNVLSVMAPFELYYITLFLPDFRTIARKLRYSEDDAGAFYDGNSAIGLQNRETSKFEPLIQWKCVNQVMKNVKINGRRIECQIVPKVIDKKDRQIDRYIAISCLPEDHEWLSNTLWNHLYEIFPLLPPEIDLVASNESLTHIPETRPIQKFHLGDAGGLSDKLTVKASDVDTFFDTHTVSEYFCLKSKLEGDLRLDSKVLDVQTLIILKSENVTSQHVLNFKGKNLILVFPKFESSGIIKMINAWIKGEVLQNLELLMFKGNLKPIDEQLILAEFNPRIWNPKERAGRFISKTVAPFYPVKENFDPFDCTNAWDIRRESDGMLASLRMFERCYISFFVWKDRFPSE